MDWLYHDMPWPVAGVLIGLFVPLLLLIGGKHFGISSNLRHMCAAVLPGKNDFLRYDWKKTGAWNLSFVAGIVLGGFIASQWMGSNDVTIPLAPDTVQALHELGIRNFTGLLPTDLFNWQSLATPAGFLMVVGGGFLVGFGSRYAGGCTSGHAITGLANLQLPSLMAVLGFFAGGLLVTHFLLPILL